MIHGHIRERIEDAEQRLSPLAAKSRYTRGRERTEEESAMRTAFQRDRDRIIHAKAFRRLKHKTQVFLAAGDHYSTRLSHTLEVSQIARSIARGLNVNEDLVEAASLGHDLGHTPFGHAGESVLDRLFPGGFRHSEHSLRVVTLLERDGMGLNLTWEVRDGIAHHSKEREGIQLTGRGFAHTVEGHIVRLSDTIAYINHDLADAVRARILAEGEVPRACAEVLGTRHSQRIDTLVKDVIDSSWEAVRAEETSVGQTAEAYTVAQAAVAEAANEGRPLVGMSSRVLAATDELRDFLFRRVYTESPAKAEEGKVKALLSALYGHFVAHSEQMPEEFRRNPHGESAEQLACDYLAGMTDNYATQVFADLYLPSDLFRVGLPGGPPVD
ncbi:MAG: deoxyguanosinetriphosphate triphosphohydrolase [Chloroflexota bacterium]